MSKQRRIHLAIFLLIVGLFATARALTPNRQGFGTHTQLGLPPCPFHALTHHRCPTCGLTTSLVYLMDGDFSAAWRSHPLGPVTAFALTFIASISAYRYWKSIRKTRPRFLDKILRNFFKTSPM